MNHPVTSHRSSCEIDPRIVRILWVNIEFGVSEMHIANHHFNQYQIERLQQHKFEPTRLVESVVKLNVNHGQYRVKAVIAFVHSSATGVRMV